MKKRIAVVELEIKSRFYAKHMHFTNEPQQYQTSMFKSSGMSQNVGGPQKIPNIT